MTMQGELKVDAEHVQENLRSNSATDLARFNAMRPSTPVASPAGDVPLDLDYAPVFIHRPDFS